MIKDTVLQHRAEKDRLIAQPLVTRSLLKTAAGLLGNGMIKVITGPRRAGKSVLALQLLAGMDFAYVNFDDEKLAGLSDYDDLLTALAEVHPGARFLLFDEIQNLPGWELFVNKLQRRGYELVLTGSNARMLSGELSTALSGRYLEIELLPFSFTEALAAWGAVPGVNDLARPEVRGQTLAHLSRYLTDGGFPEVVVRGLPAREYLSTLLDAVLFKDVVRRHAIRHPQRLYAMALHLTSSFAAEFTHSRLKNLLGFNSVTTVESYADHLEQAYVMRSLGRYSHKVGQLARPPRKAYVVDTGLVGAATFQVSPATGRLVENCVFLELVRRGFKPGKSLFYYRTGYGKEVDFVLRKGTRVVSLIQSCLDPRESRGQEAAALAAAGRQLGCDDLLIVTWDLAGEESASGDTVRIVPLFRWLLGS